MRRVVLESPYNGDVEANTTYARACVRDCLKRGEAPIASHLLFTQPGILKDEVPEERRLGMEAGFAWTLFAEAVVVDFRMCMKELWRSFVDDDLEHVDDGFLMRRVQLLRARRRWTGGR